MISIIIFKLLPDEIEVLVKDQGSLVSHYDFQNNGQNLEITLRQVKQQSNLDFLVISTVPIYRKQKEAGNKEICYFAGIVDPHIEIISSNENIEYRWLSIQKVRKYYSLHDDKMALDKAKEWLHSKQEAAIYLAFNLEKLQY